MSVYCTNSGNTYAGLAELAAAEAGLHVGDVVIELSGVNTGDASFTAQDFDSIKIIAASGEEFDPTTSTGAIHAAKLTSTCTLTIDGTRIEEIAVVYPTTQVLNSEIGSLGNVGITYGSSNNVYMYNTVIRDTYRGSYSTASNPNATLENCTLYNNSNLGLLRCNCINTVVIDCAGTDYFSAVSQTNTWGDDASAQNIVAEGYATFVDFASGDVRIRSDSDAGLAGAGAFIQQSEPSLVGLDATGAAFSYSFGSANAVSYRLISIQSESVSYSGFDAQLHLSRVINVYGSNYSLSSADVGLAYNQLGSYEIDLSNASFNRSESNIALIHDRTVNLSSENYSYVGFGAKLLHSKGILVGESTNSVSGGDIQLLRDFLADPNGGQFSYHGDTMSLDYSGRVVGLISGYTVKYKSSPVDSAYQQIGITTSYNKV